MRGIEWLTVVAVAFASPFCKPLPSAGKVAEQMEFQLVDYPLATTVPKMVRRIFELL